MGRRAFQQGPALFGMAAAMAPWQERVGSNQPGMRALYADFNNFDEHG